MLQSEFVPAVGNTHELQNQESAARDWFIGMAQRANPRIQNGQTSQGFYVAGPDGTSYGFNNNRSPERVLAFMKQGLARYKSDPPKTVQLSREEVELRYSLRPPEGATVLRVFSRIHPPPEDASDLNFGVGRDHLWLMGDEARQIVRGTLPVAFTTRLVRFHLVDNVRGEPDFWHPDQVRRATFRLTPIPGGQRIVGEFAMAKEGDAQGIEGTIVADIRIDFATGRVVGFKAFGESQAWGVGRWTPNAPKGRFPLLFAITLVDDEAAQMVPPQAGQYPGSEYKNPRKPASLIVGG